MADAPMILSQQFVQEHFSENICRKINEAIPDASVIVSVVHERDELGHLVATVYYRG